jgi:hypothetical protein
MRGITIAHTVTTIAAMAIAINLNGIGRNLITYPNQK